METIGLSKELPEGKTVWEALPPETAAAVEQRYRAALAGISSVFEASCAGHTYLVHAAPVRNGRGVICGGMAMMQDITAQKQAEAALRKERDFISAVLETVAALVTVFDRAGRLVQFNRASQQLSGYSFDELRGKFFCELPLLIPEEIDALKGVFAALTAGQFPNQHENYWVTKDGRRRLIAWSNTALLGPDGAVEYVIGTGIDITDQKRAEEALHESQQRFALFMDNLPGCAWMKDPEGRYVYVNRRLENLQPYRDGWRGKTDAQLWPSEMATQYRVNDLKVIASREALQTVEPYLAEGEQRQVLVSKFPILDETGAVVLVGGASVEITERLRAEEALRQSEERFRIALKTSPVVVFNHDRDLRYTWVYNPTRGVSAEEILGKTDEELLSSRDAAQLTRIKRHVLERGAGVRIEAELTTGGVRNVYDLNVEPLRDSQGQIIGVTCVALDITDRKRAEEALRATSEQLRALSASLRSAREEEGARIARELHDELGSAMTSLKWDLEDINKLCSKAGNQTDSSMLREKIAGMMKLIDATINTVRRISWELRPSILDDLGLVAAIEWQAQQFEARTGIVCQFNSFGDNSDLSREQATAIFRTFQEALTNILRHARATRVNIMIEEKEGEFVLEVKDNGRGITDDERTGLRSLGLIGMRERAHLVGGRIEISGVTGQGTVLTLRVPMDSPAAD